MMIVFRNVSSVVSSSRGCFEKTEKKTPPLSGGALIRAERERVLVRTFLSFFPSFSAKTPLFFFLEKTNHIKDQRKKKKKKKKFLSSSFAEKSEKCQNAWSEDASAEKTDWSERFFVGFDREERRYLFHTHSSEIEFD